jgi:hypothetical protein
MTWPPPARSGRSRPAHHRCRQPAWPPAAGYTDNELRIVLKFMRDGREVAVAEIDRIRSAGTPA